MRGLVELGTLCEVKGLGEGRLIVSAKSIGGRESILELSVLSLLYASTMHAELAKLRDPKHTLFPGGCYKKELVPAPCLPPATCSGDVWKIYDVSTV